MSKLRMAMRVLGRCCLTVASCCTAKIASSSTSRVLVVPFFGDRDRLRHVREFALSKNGTFSFGRERAETSIPVIPQFLVRRINLGQSGALSLHRRGDWSGLARGLANSFRTRLWQVVRRDIWRERGLAVAAGAKDVVQPCVGITHTAGNIEEMRFRRRENRSVR